MCSLIVRNPTPLSSVAQYVDLPDYSCTCFTTSPIDQQRTSTNELVAPLKRAPQAIPTLQIERVLIAIGAVSIPNGLHRPFRQDENRSRSMVFLTTEAIEF